MTHSGADERGGGKGITKFKYSRLYYIVGEEKNRANF